MQKFFSFDILDSTTALLEEVSIFITKESVLVSFIIIALCIELVSRHIKKKMKQSIFSKYDRSTDPEHAEFYLDYYRRGQVIDIIRVSSILVLISFFIVSRTGAGVNFFVIATGAIIIIFKDFILSIIAFFIIVRNYRIGDTLGIGDVQGQIIYIRMFSVGVLGKDNDGDNTGRAFIIPSHKFITESIRKEDLHSNSIRKELLRIPYKTESFSVTFDEFIHLLEEFLIKNLPTLSKKNCGNYQTYIGYKYKMDIDYLEEKCIIITIGLVGKWEINTENKRKIVAFTEGYKIKGIDSSL